MGRKPERHERFFSSMAGAANDLKRQLVTAGYAEVYGIYGKKNPVGARQFSRGVVTTSRGPQYQIAWAG